MQVRARIAQLGGLSGHADKDGLEEWLRAFDEKPRFIFVNHGEDAVAEHWANHLKEEGYEADAPYNGSIWIAAEGRVACAEAGNTQKILRTKTAAAVRTSAAYDRLLQYGPAPAGGHPPQSGRCQQGPCKICGPDRGAVR